MDFRQFGKRVAQLRKAKGWTQVQLAEAIGVSRQQVQNWERGRKGTPTRRLMKLYEILGVTPEQFWDEDYLPNSLPLSGINSTAYQAIPEVDERQRALRCPRCGAPSNHAVDPDAIYCYSCGYPMYNVCVGKERHVNPAHARFCGRCQARTVWSLSEGELVQAGFEVPPLEVDGHNIGSSGQAPVRR